MNTSVVMLWYTNNTLHTDNNVIDKWHPTDKNLTYKSYHWQWSGTQMRLYDNNSDTQLMFYGYCNKRNEIDFGDILKIITDAAPLS